MPNQEMFILTCCSDCTYAGLQLRTVIPNLVVPLSVLMLSISTQQISVALSQDSCDEKSKDCLSS